MGMSSLIHRVAHAALRTFARRKGQDGFALPEDEFRAALAELVALVDRLRATDLGLDHSRALAAMVEEADQTRDRDKEQQKQTGKKRQEGEMPSSSSSSTASLDSEGSSSFEVRPTAGGSCSNFDSGISMSVYDPCGRLQEPVTYIEILECPVVTIGIFLVRRGCRIPLHNHPDMYGIIKCLHGRFDLTSFSHLNESEVATLEVPESISRRRDVFPARREVFTGISPDSATCYLTPDDRNYHELVACDEPFAFLDILAPPYSTEIALFDGLQEDEERRDCDFFKEVLSNKRISWLKWIDMPQDYSCDSDVYSGPSVKHIREEFLPP